MPPRVGLFGPKREPELRALAEALSRRGARAELVDFYSFPRFTRTTALPPGRHDDLHLEQPVDLCRLDLLCLRTLCFAEHPAPGEEDAEAVVRHYRQQRERLVLQLNLVRALCRRIPVINPPDSFLFHRLKAWQHHRLLSAGLPVPPTLAGVDGERVRAFAAEQGPDLVVKNGAGGGETLRLDAARAAGFGRRPRLFQRCVKGRAVRVYLLGGRCVSAGELVHDPKHLDWRGHTQKVLPITLPGALLAELGRAARLLGLPYCGMDLELTPGEAGERAWLLDVNPAALFVGWSRLRRVDLADAIAGYLLDVLAHGGDPWFATAKR